MSVVCFSYLSSSRVSRSVFGPWLRGALRTRFVIRIVSLSWVFNIKVCVSGLTWRCTMAGSVIIAWSEAL